MVIIKLSAEQERLVRKAQTESDLRGVRDMLVDVLDRAHVLKSFGKAPSYKERTFNWKDALLIVQEVVGRQNVTIPPFPESTWYARIQGHIRRNRLDADAIRSLAEYARDHIRMPSSLDFILGQAPQILAGNYDIKAAPVPANTLGPEL